MEREREESLRLVKIVAKPTSEKRVSDMHLGTIQTARADKKLSL